MEFEIPILDARGKEVERIKLDSARLDACLRSRLVKEAVVMYQANKRQGTHDTKTRAEIAASNRKPWRQKGTGRARAGTRRSPLWRGGGIIFGPHPRDYSYQINRKQKRRALRSALYAKFRSGDVRVVSAIELPEPKTRHVAGFLAALGVSGRVLLGSEALDRRLWQAGRNIAGLTILPVDEFNALEVLQARTIILTRAALDRLLERFETPIRARAAAGGGSNLETGDGGGA